MPLPKAFYLNPDTVAVAQNLLGKELITNLGSEITSGIITETEAYCGETDKASHSFGGRRTNRTETMYAEGGTAYVYLCYGIHHLFNVVTNESGTPHAVLIRAIFPYKGIATILERRKQTKVTKITAGGPGTVSSALGIKKTHSGRNLLNGDIAIEDTGIIFPTEKINVGSRIGVDYADEDALLPYRFWVDFNIIKEYVKIPV